MSIHQLDFQGSLVVENLPASAGDAGLIPGSGRSPREGNGNPFQYYCLGNPMNRGAWRAIVHGVIRVRCDLATKQYINYLSSEGEDLIALIFVILQTYTGKTQVDATEALIWITNSCYWQSWGVFTLGCVLVNVCIGYPHTFLPSLPWEPASPNSNSVILVGLLVIVPSPRPQE